jgi:hypothetical protein
MYRGTKLSLSASASALRNTGKVQSGRLSRSFPLKRCQSTASGAAAAQETFQDSNFDPTIAPSSYPSTSLPKFYKSHINSSINSNKHSSNMPIATVLKGVPSAASSKVS